MKFKVLFTFIALAALTVFAAQRPMPISGSNGVATFSFSSNFLYRVGTLEGKLDKRWIPLENFFITQQSGTVTFALPPGYSEFRVVNVSIAPGNAFKNLALVYGNLETVGGLGPVVPPGANAWLPEFEGANALVVPLSNPRNLVADLAGNIYFTEKDSHALSVIEASNNVYHTVIGPLDFPPGTRTNGFFPVQPGYETPARYIAMQDPSGLFYRNEKIYVLDAGNSRVLRFTNGTAGPTNGTVTLIFNATDFAGVPVAITNGNGLWVSEDELEAFYTDGTKLKRWKAATGVETIPANFVDLVAVTKNPDVKTVVVDRGAHAVFQVNNDGIKDLVAGNGRPLGRAVGKANSVSLNGPSSIWYLPVGGYLIGLDQGAGVWQVDAGNNAAELVFGEPGVHAGDGEWFQKGRRDPKVSNVQSVTVAPSGDILMIEGGYIRRIKFLRHKP